MPTFPFATPDRFQAFIDNAVLVRLWLTGLGVRDAERGSRDLRDLSERVAATERVADLAARLDVLLPRCPDPGMALTNLDRFVAASADPGGMLASLVEDSRAIEIVVQLFSTSQFFSELMIRDPALLDWLRSGADRRDPARLIDDLWAEMEQAPTTEARRLALRRFRLREVLRIGYNDIVRDLPLELITLDLAHLADACVEVAVRSARLSVATRHGQPLVDRDTPARFVVLALGKLGGEELNYSSDIDLIFVYDHEGQTNGPRVISNSEFFARVGAEVVRTLSDHTSLGLAYRVDMRLRPEGDQGPLARSLAATLGYYQTSGRTWERQALIKCRGVAGDLDLGADFLQAITPFVYRRYLGAAEIGEIKAMKRRIEQRTVSAGTANVEVKTGHGGIRDVEFVVQFLQLLHGGEYPEVRHANTTVALSQLEAVGCLTTEERGIMVDTYRFLRRVEHRLQTMFDRQTHEMPGNLEDQRTLAIRLGYPPANHWEDRTGPAQRFLADYRAKTEQNRSILNHLLHDAFPGDDGVVDPVVDLVLDPSPTPEMIERALGSYPFRDKISAYHNLMALAREESPFLSEARCRHFLAGIAPRLLVAVGRAADPDMALRNLEKVSASLGAKAMLWELFNLDPPTLRLYVEVCSTSQLLSEILIGNPGMVDDLMDSLVVNQSQPTEAIHTELAELCHRAEDVAPILLGFRNKEWIRIGTRDILKREPIRDVTRELADVAEAIVVQVARDLWRRRCRRHGTPRRASDGRVCSWAVVALGRLGGRELSYHSDLDLIFLYDEDGQTSGRWDQPPISNAQFYADLTRQVLRTLEEGAGSGPIYTVDARLRPHGSSGLLALPLGAVRDYYLTQAQIWERLALTRARVLCGRALFVDRVQSTIHEILTTPIDPATLRDAVRIMRRKLEASRGPADIKRGVGGLADVEFLVQSLQLRHARQASIIQPNLWDALDSLRAADLIGDPAYGELRHAYEFTRSVENRLRLQSNRAVLDWPTLFDDVARLSGGMSREPVEPVEAVATFRAEVDQTRRISRHYYETILDCLTG